MNISVRNRAAVILLMAGLACKGGNDPSGADPIVTGVTPSVGTVGTELRISGSGFRAGAAVDVGEFPATGIALSGDTVVFASVPLGVEADSVYDVTVRNADGTEVVFDSAFTAVAPILRFVNSATKPSGQIGSTVILEGSAFGDLQGVSRVLFDNGSGGTVAATIAAPADWTDTFIVTTVPTGAATGPVMVETGTGLSSSLPFTLTQNAVFSPSTITWSTTQDLPQGVSGHHALFVPIDDAGGVTVQRVYVTGGSRNDDAPVTDVNFATIQSDGSLSGWTTGTALPAAREFHRTVAATPFNSKVQGSGHLYVLGGMDDTGTPVTDVQRATFSDDGTLGTFSASTPLPEGLHSFGAVIFRSAIYVVGGAATGDVPVATVYRSFIDTLGVLGAWEELTALPSSRAYHGVGVFGTFLYAVGGEGGTVTADDGNFLTNSTKLNEIVFSRINLRTSDIDAAWTVNPSAMTKSRTKHSALFAGGNLFVTAGLYAAAGTGSTENVYAQINSDGTTSSFNGATGSNTIQTLGGINLFNHSAIGYVDGTGVAHVMILGGDDVNNVGTKSKMVFFY